MRHFLLLSALLIFAPSWALASTDPAEDLGPTSALTSTQTTALTIAAPIAGLSLLMWGPSLKEPYDKVGHALVGAALSAGLSEYTSPAIGLLGAAVVGVVKEKLDHVYDPHDAAATILGGIAGVILWRELAPGAKNRLFFTPRGFVYTTQF